MAGSHCRSGLASSRWQRWTWQGTVRRPGRHNGARAARPLDARRLRPPRIDHASRGCSHATESRGAGELPIPRSVFGTALPARSACRARLQVEDQGQGLVDPLQLFGVQEPVGSVRRLRSTVSSWSNKTRIC